MSADAPTKDTERRPLVKRLDSLTGLRAVAALAVFLCHSAGAPWSAHIVPQGRVGVSFFYILSGFVLMWAFDDRTSAKRFYRRRMARIYPAYIVALVLSLAVNMALEGDKSLVHLLISGLMLQSWVPDQGTYFGINGVAWSMSCEVFFYATFPLWSRWLAATTPRRRLQAACAALAAIWLIAIVAQIVAPGGDTLAPDGSATAWFVRVFPPVRLLEFFLGAWMAVEVRSGRRVPVTFPVAVAIATVSYFLIGFWENRITMVAFTVVPLMLVIASAADANVSGRKTGFTSRRAVWAGEISYSFYLTHQIALHVIDQIHLWPVPVRVVLGLAVAVPLAAAFHHAIEKPLERRLRGEPLPALRDAAAADAAAATATPAAR